MTRHRSAGAHRSLRLRPRPDRDHLTRKVHVGTVETVSPIRLYRATRSPQTIGRQPPGAIGSPPFVTHKFGFAVPGQSGWATSAQGGSPMSAGATVAIIVVIVIIIVVAVFAAMAARRRRLKERFGPEYDRLVADQQSQRKAEAELAGRERRVRHLDIRPLSAAARTEYAGQWSSIQERFVDHPASAVSEAQQLVTAVLRDRGYPTEGYEQIM